jgi:NADH-quinone oxidoreductase subunit M
MQQYLLSLLIFTPLCAAIVIVLLPVRFSNSFRSISLGASVLQGFWLILIFLSYNPQTSFQFLEQTSWIRLSLGNWGVLKADYLVGLDGLSLPLIALAVVIMAIATIASWRLELKRKGYFILLLILNTSIIGSFSALDFFLFYLFFEFMLLPMYFLIGIWGGRRREYASIKFFLYTLLGSILILIVLIALYISYHTPDAGNFITHTFNLLDMYDTRNVIAGSLLDPHNATDFGPLSVRSWAFLFLFLGFAIKVPTFPLHTWLPDAHVEASTPISVILAALLLKIGGYGLLRIAFPIFPDAAAVFSMTVGIIGVISIIYGALNAMGSKDLKRLIAYSSISHMGFVILGIASQTTEGVTGAVYQMVSHGILSAMLFLLAGVLYDQTKDRTIANYSGLVEVMPGFFVFILIAFFASMGLPGFSGFIGEIFVLLGAFKSGTANGLLHESLAIFATGGLVLAAGYFLWVIQRMFFGRFDVKGLADNIIMHDVKKRDIVVLVPLAIASLVFGLFPQLLLDIINPFSDEFVRHCSAIYSPHKL